MQSHEAKKKKCPLMENCCADDCVWWFWHWFNDKGNGSGDCCFHVLARETLRIKELLEDKKNAER